MHRFYDLDKTTQYPHERKLAISTIRTYRQIAAILTKREGLPISSVHVKQMCRMAERKFARALLADHVIRTQLQSGKSQGYQAIQPEDVMFPIPTIRTSTAN